MNQKYINVISPLLPMDTLVTVVHLCRSQIYSLMDLGLFMRPVNISERRVVWLSSEVEQWIKAKVAGKSDSEIKALVIRLKKERNSGEVI